MHPTPIPNLHTSRHIPLLLGAHMAVAVEQHRLSAGGPGLQPPRPPLPESTAVCGVVPSKSVACWLCRKNSRLITSSWSGF